MMNKKHRPTILIVEDHPDWQKTLEVLFEPLDVQLKIAPNLTQGLEIAEQHAPDSENPIDLVILDMRIPVAKGDQADLVGGIKFLTQYQFLSPSVPIIVFTAFEGYDNCVKAIKGGAYYYLPKMDPMTNINNSKRLLEMCKELISREKEPEAEEHASPDEKWFDKHHHEVRERYPGRYVIFLPATIVAVQANSSVSCEELDGVRMLAADSYNKLRSCILQDPALRKYMPIIVFVEGGSS